MLRRSRAAGKQGARGLEAAGPIANELKIAEGKPETIRSVVGVGFGQVAMILAVLRLFPSVHS